eukprot:TRINITY_DN6130_c0_g1_i4.p1 TRINITY_DN6130_c0_g1~~TRINITY_DN6130_c0_g1_i4.p1  ORF type:complete len:101 (+),score=9.06 TRINITY_DN6130_c0_g1_i4:579-881(+)
MVNFAHSIPLQAVSLYTSFLSCRTFLFIQDRRASLPLFIAYLQGSSLSLSLSPYDYHEETFLFPHRIPLSQSLIKSCHPISLHGFHFCNHIFYLVVVYGI